MRVVALAALACALGLSVPCAAQKCLSRLICRKPFPYRSNQGQRRRSFSRRLSRFPPPTRRLSLTDPRLSRSPRQCLLVSPESARAVRAPRESFSTPDRLVEWVYNYHAHPTPWRVPAAVHAMRDLGLFTDEEKGAFCTGFIAGVLGANAKDGPALVGKMLPMPDKDQAVLIRAIAFSGRPDWRDLLTKYRARMPLRQPLIDSYLSGKAKPLMEVELSDGPSVVYTLWGYYVATGQYEPVVRIMQALRWSRNKDDGNFSIRKIFSGWHNDPSAVDKISTGATAKWTLASYAERNRDLLNLYRAEYSGNLRNRQAAEGCH